MGARKNETSEEREARLAYNRAWHVEHREDQNKKRMDRYYCYQQKGQLTEYRICRLFVLQRMGSKCCFCNEIDEAVLTVDHVKNDGAKERKDQNRNIFHRLARMADIPKDRYQILCCYCNHKKRIYGDDPSTWPIRTVDEALIEIPENERLKFENDLKGENNASPPKDQRQECRGFEKGLSASGTLNNPNFG